MPESACRTSRIPCGGCVSGPNFTVNNQTMGTYNWKGAHKTMCIQVCDDRGNTRDFKYGEGATGAFIYVPRPGVGREQAWGWNPPNTANVLRINYASWGSGSRMQNVTERLRGTRCGHNNRISVEVMLVPRAPITMAGVSKTLIVNYTWQDSPRQTLCIRRGDAEFAVPIDS